MEYDGKTPIPGMSATQQAVCEAALRLADPTLHDGLNRSIKANIGTLPSTPPDATVLAAIQTALLDAGIEDLAWFRPFSLTVGVSYAALGTCAGAMIAEEQAGAPLDGSGRMAA